MQEFDAGLILWHLTLPPLCSIMDVAVCQINYVHARSLLSEFAVPAISVPVHPVVQKIEMKLIRASYMVCGQIPEAL